MKRSCIILGLVLLTALLLVGQSYAIEIFVWQHDNQLRVADPVLRTTITATDAVRRTLDLNNIDYDTNTELPEDLDQYDVIMTCLSFYCPG